MPDAVDYAALPDAALLRQWRQDNQFGSDNWKHWPLDQRTRAIQLVEQDAPWVGQSTRRLERGQAALESRADEIVNPEILALDLRALSGETPPPRSWAIDYWLCFGHPHLLIGAGGIGKSTLALMMAASMGLGRDFIDKVQRPLRVVVFACEDDETEIWRRLHAIAAHFGVTLADLAENLVVVPRLGMDNVLLASEYGTVRITPLMGRMAEFCRTAHAEVVILDNLAHLFGGNENDRHHVTTFLNALSGALPNMALLLLGHPSRAAGSEFSGSSAWENAVRARFYLGRTLPDQRDDESSDDDGIRYLSRRKANYAPRDFRRFSMQNGILVPDQVTQDTGGLIPSLRKRQAERVVIESARKLAGMGIRFTDGSTSPQYLPRQILEYKLHEGLTKRELTDAMRTAMLDGKLTRGVVGKYQNRLPMEGLIVK